MAAPSFRSFDDARKHYAKTLGDEFRQTSEWLRAPEHSHSLDWVSELTGRLHRWIGTVEGIGLPTVANLAKNLNRRVQTIAPSDRQNTVLLQRNITDCIGLIDQMHTQLHHSASSTQTLNAEAGTIWVLIADDDEALTRPLLSELTRLGFAVACCRSIAEASIWLKQQTPQLIVLAHQLPDGDGLALCRRLTAAPRLQRTAIVLLAADGFDKADAFQAGAQAYYDKPIDVATLTTRLDDLLRQHAYQASRHRLLIVDADDTRAKQLAASLQHHGFDAAICLSTRRLFELASTQQSEILLLRTPVASRALSLCRLIRQEERLLTTPIVVMVESAGSRFTLQGLEAGADLVVEDDAQPKMLAAMMTAHLERLRTLAAMADRDGLTGLWNHDYFVRHLAMEVERATRYGGQFVLALADLDDFKQLNDTHGHLIGDRALQHVAYFLKRRFRRTDIVARYGGEEFAIILQHTTLSQASRVLTDACDAALSLRVPGARGGMIPMSFSMGAAEFPIHGWDTDSIFQAADQALYEAKRLGKHRIAFAPNTLSTAEPGARDLSATNS